MSTPRRYVTTANVVVPAGASSWCHLAPHERSRLLALFGGPGMSLTAAAHIRGRVIFEPVPLGMLHRIRELHLEVEPHAGLELDVSNGAVGTVSAWVGAVWEYCDAD